MTAKDRIAEEGNSVRLPKDFTERMRRLLGKEAEEFLKSYDMPRTYGLRRNLLKGEEDFFLQTIPFTLEKISWAKEGYYYDPEEQPGRHVLHEIGAYYIQEPSAMAVVEILDPRPGEKILDLCAAPGGKSTQIAGRMGGAGLLLSNEIVPERARTLSRNIERMGVKNAVVCGEAPKALAMRFPSFFDRILVDAPCSGEGMFRKDETAVQEWSAAQVEVCAARQLSIMEEAAVMLKPGGVLVYSTCTFSPEENEGVISSFLKKHPEFLLEKIPEKDGFLAARGDWILEPAEGIDAAVRLMPHRLRGEGHFAAKLRKEGSLCGMRGLPQEADKRLCRQIQSFLEDELQLTKGFLERQEGSIIRFGEQICLLPDGIGELKGMKILRPGLQLAVEKKNRLEPAHALALALRPEECEKKLSMTSKEAERYLCGEGLTGADAPKGFLLMVHDGYSVGFGKAAGGQIKNHYPKGLRKDVSR